MQRWLIAAGIAAVAFIGGLLAGRQSADDPALAPTFALMLYGGSTGDSTAHDARAAEYGAWAAMTHASGTVIGGQALSSGGIAIFKPDTNRFSGVVVSVIDGTDPNELVGFFLVNAPNRQAAMQLASDCPHLRYGGRVVVRAIQ